MWKFTGSIRSQIALILLLAIIPLGLLAVYLAVDERTTEVARARADSRAILRLISQDLDQIIESSDDMVLGLSRNTTLRKNPDVCSAQLAEINSAFPQFVNMVMINADLRITCIASNPLNLKAISKTPEALDLLNRARQTRQVVVGTFFSNQATGGKKIMPIVAPMFDSDGKINSFFFANLNLDWLNDRLNNIALPAEAVLLVLDRHGTEVARNPKDARWSLGSPAPAFEQTLLRRPGFEEEIKGIDGINRFYSVLKVGGSDGLLVVMKIRSDTIARAAQDRLIVTLCGLGGIGLLVFGLAWVGTNRYFSRPLARLIRTANEISAGSLDARSGLSYSGELGDLARSFDQMANTLEQDNAREKKAAAEKAKLEAQLNQAQKMESVGRLAGGVAHDFNNLLTVIIGYSSMLLEGKLLPPQAESQVRQIKMAGERANGLTRQLLTFSRKQVLAPRSLNLNTVVAEIVAMLTPMMGEDIQIESAPAPDLGFVKADAGQLHQVVMNLAVNARDAMPNGGRLRLETANVQLDEPFTAEHPGISPGPYVLLGVTDSGSGMDAATMQSIFDPFFTTKPVGEGTGLGLATVHGIVSQSGGCLCVQSELGKGTSFRIYLPRIESPAVPAATQKTGPSLEKRPTAAILVVEDQDAVREFTATVLKSLGYRVLTASGGEEAMRVVQEGAEIDLILTDVVMKGISGPELATQLEIIRPGTKILYVSGYTENMAIRRGALTADFHYLPKPFSPKDLAAKVRSMIG